MFYFKDFFFLIDFLYPKFILFYSFADCEVEWHFNQIGNPLPYGVHKRGNQIIIPNVQQQHTGNYICSVYHQFGRAESNPGRLDINRSFFLNYFKYNLNDNVIKFTKIYIRNNYLIKLIKKYFSTFTTNG